MATTVLAIVRGISQAPANAYDGSQDERYSYDGESRKIGLKREEGDPIVDSRVVDGFGVVFHGNLLCISYQSDIKLKEVYAGDIEADLAGAADDHLHGIMSCPAGRSANGFRP